MGPVGDGKTAIRGGAGIFTGFLNNAVANVTTELSGMGDPDNINIVLATATSPLGLPTSFAVYQSLLARGILGQRAITLADVAVAPLNINPRPGAPLEVRFRLGPDYRNPTTYQTSFGVQRDLGAGLSLDLNYLSCAASTSRATATSIKSVGPARSTRSTLMAARLSPAPETSQSRDASRTTFTKRRPIRSTTLHRAGAEAIRAQLQSQRALHVLEGD